MPFNDSRQSQAEHDRNADGYHKDDGEFRYDAIGHTIHLICKNMQVRLSYRDKKSQSKAGCHDNDHFSTFGNNWNPSDSQLE